MDLQDQFCHNPDCAASGKVGQGNIVAHSRKEGRCKCTVCGKTFSLTKGTAYFGLRKPKALVTVVTTLMAHGCPVQAVVRAFGLDERTVAKWLVRGGDHSQTVHDAIVVQGNVEVGVVQADEMWVKMVARKVWMAMAMAIPSRLWLGGVISEKRDLKLITRLVRIVRACALTTAILVCVDGLSSYVTAFRKVFREPLRTGGRGRPPGVMPSGFLMAQVVKKYEKYRMTRAVRRVVVGTKEAVTAALKRWGAGKVINTAYIERLNATFRTKLSCLVRRARTLLHREDVLNSAMYLFGGVYNFCEVHESLRVLALQGTRRKWQERTPAMAAGLTDHPWSVEELLSFRVPPRGCGELTSPGHPSRATQNPTLAMAP